MGSGEFGSSGYRVANRPIFCLYQFAVVGLKFAASRERKKSANAEYVSIHTPPVSLVDFSGRLASPDAPSGHDITPNDLLRERGFWRLLR